MFNKILRYLSKGRIKAVQYFTHIPKTAGTSFIVLLDRFYAVSDIFPTQLWRETESIDAKKNQGYDLFRGHFGGGGVSVLTDRPIEYFTILRHPDALAKSTYQYVLREKNTKVHQLVKDQKMTFSAFLKNPMTSPLVQNRMIRNISFDFKEDPAAQEVFLSPETITYLQSIINQQSAGIADEQRLQRAIKFVDECRWFGLLEQFEESLQLLCFEMKWPPFGQSQKLNVHSDKTSYKNSEADLLATLNQHDLVLYNHAFDVFKQRLSAMNEVLLPFKTNELQSTDELIDLYYQKHQSNNRLDDLSESLDYGFEQRLLGSQWHRRELMQPENEYFRWTGPGAEATIDFWLVPNNFTVSMRIINATSLEMLDDMIIHINDHEVIWETQDNGLVRILKFSCHKSHIRDNGLLRLKLTCKHMVSHRQAFGSNDERLVGVAIHWIKINHEK